VPKEDPTSRKRLKLAERGMARGKEGPGSRKGASIVGRSRVKKRGGAGRNRRRTWTFAQPESTTQLREMRREGGSGRARSGKRFKTTGAHHRKRKTFSSPARRVLSEIINSETKKKRDMMQEKEGENWRRNRG